MAEQAKRNWKIWILVAVLILAGGGYFAKTMIEKKMAGDIETFLANLPAGYSMKAQSIKVDALSKSAVLTGLSGSGKIGESGVAVTLTADSAEASGLNLNAFKEKGVTTLADSLVLRNLKINGGDLFDAQVGMYQIDKMQGDFVALAEQSVKIWSIVRAGTNADKAGDKAASKKAQADLMAAFKDPAFFAALETVRVGRAATQNYAANFTLPAGKDFKGGKFGFLMDSSEGKDYSVGRCGPAFARGLKVTMNGAPLFSLDEMSVQGMDMPSHKEIMKMGETGDKPPFKDLRISLKDLKLKKLDVVLPTENKDAISMAAFGLSFTMDKGSGALALKVDQLDMPTALLVQDNPIALSVRELLPKRTLLDKDVDVVVTGKDKDVADVNIKKANASIKDLGAVAISGDILDIAMAGGRSDSLLRKLDISVTDQGAMKIIFTARAMMEGADADALRATLVALVEAQRDSLPNETLKSVLTSAAEFLKLPGGTVRLTIAPEKPVSTREARMLMMREPEKLGISSSFTPGK